MSRQELEQSWARTRHHLEQAEQLIAPLADRTQLATFTEWLSHNELELALDVLSEIGEAFAPGVAPDRFWDELALAASNMKLEKKAAHLRSRRRG